MASNSLWVALVIALLAIVSVGGDEVPPGENLKDVAVHALNSSLIEAYKFSQYIVKLREEEKTKSKTVFNALSYCVKLIDDAVSQIYSARMKLKDLSDSPLNNSVSDIWMQLYDVTRNQEACVDEVNAAVLSDPKIWLKPDLARIFNLVSDRIQGFVQSLKNALSAVNNVGKNP